MHKRKNPDLMAWRRLSPSNAVFWWGDNERRAKQMVEDMYIDIPFDKKLLFLRLARFEFGRAVRLGLLHPHLLNWINRTCSDVGNKRKAAMRKANSGKPPVLLSIRVSAEMYAWLESQPHPSIREAASDAVARYYRESGKNTPRSDERSRIGRGVADIHVYVDAKIHRVSGSKSGAVRKMIKWAMEQDK